MSGLPAANAADQVSYDGWISIEHEDAVISRNEGVRRTATALTQAMVFEAADYEVQSVAWTL